MHRQPQRAGFEHPQCQLADETGLLGERDEVGRRQQAALHGAASAAAPRHRPRRRWLQRQLGLQITGAARRAPPRGLAQLVSRVSDCALPSSMAGSYMPARHGCAGRPASPARRGGSTCRRRSACAGQQAMPTGRHSRRCSSSPAAARGPRDALRHAARQLGRALAQHANWSPAWRHQGHHRHASPGAQPSAAACVQAVADHGRAGR